MRLIFFILPIFYLIIPFGLIAWMWRNPQKSIKIYFLKVLIIGIYLFNLFLVGVWPFFFFGYFTRYLFIILFGISIIRSFNILIKHRHLKKKKAAQSIKKRIAYTLGYAFMLTLSGIMGWEIISALKGAKKPRNGIELNFPLKHGAYYVAQGGNDQTINHHYDVSGQKFALDIVKLNKWGLRSNKLIPNQLGDYNIFETNLYSPISGTIIKACDTAKDLPPSQMDRSNPPGNYLIIRPHKTDKAIVLAHLLRGSLKVKEKEAVQEGQILAKVGNSGNTSEPHLHIHCVVINEREDFFYEAVSIPMFFNNAFLVRNSIYSSD